MRRSVDILTNLDTRCGNAQYARNLQQQLLRWYEVRLVPNVSSVLGFAPDVVIWNWHPARVEATGSLVGMVKEQGTKVILILQNSFGFVDAPGEGDILYKVDRIVAHEPMENLPDTFRYIPHGILEVPYRAKCLSEWTIGSAGFPFPWKRMDVVVRAAKETGGRALLVAPVHEYYDPSAMFREWQQELGNRLTLITEWLPEEEVVKALGHATVNLFWFQSRDITDQLGQSGSARIGVAARRPLVLSRHRKLRTLIEGHEDELYVVDREEDLIPILQQLKAAWERGDTLRCPGKLIQEQGWSVVGERYRDLVEEVCGA